MVGHASTEELSVIARSVDAAGCRDCLERWTLVAFRDPGHPQADVHALGWRLALENTWITSRLVAVDALARAVATMSGHVYGLGRADVEELEPELRDHLRHALREWRFEDVQEAGTRTETSRRRQEGTSDVDD